MRLTVEVTNRDINAGCARSLVNCPIARAVRRAMRKVTGKKCYAEVFTTVTIFKGESVWGGGGTTFLTEVRTPKRAVRFIEDFDAEKPVAPFSFSINLPKKAFS